MKTKEFITKVKEMGHSVQENDSCINVYNEEDLIMQVYKLKPYAMDTFWDGDVPSDLFNLGVEYAKTPIEEREEPKKYYLRLPKDFIGVGLSGHYSYLNFDREAEDYYFENKSETEVFQTQFTQEEIDKLDTTHLIKEEVVE